MGLNWAGAKDQILATIPQSDDLDEWIEFCSTSKKGIAFYRKSLASRKEEHSYSKH